MYWVKDFFWRYDTDEYVYRYREQEQNFLSNKQIFRILSSFVAALMAVVEGDPGAQESLAAGAAAAAAVAVEGVVGHSHNLGEKGSIVVEEE